jgi:hypothetical protein
MPEESLTARSRTNRGTDRNDANLPQHFHFLVVTRIQDFPHETELPGI